MNKLRVFFSKTGRAKYISHLDCNRCWQRAIRRSGLPVWYTEGFNPHLYLTFPLPLSLGVESLCEPLDLRLLEELPQEEILRRLNDSLPPDIRALRCGEPQMDQKEIAWADYQLALHCADPAALKEQLLRYLEQPEIVVLKKTKKGEKPLDLKPLFALLDCKEGEGALELGLRCAAGIENNLNPSLLLENFPGWAQVERCDQCRCAILNDKLEPFA